MSVKLLTEHHLEFLSLKGDCTGSPESTLVKIPHCWKSHVTAQMSFTFIVFLLCMYLVLLSLPRGAMGWSVICDGGLSRFIFS